MKDRLNLGSGKTYLSDCVNVDIRDNVGADIVGDMRTLEFPPESFCEIVARDVIAHVSFVEALQVLRKCYLWLKPNGALEIHTPNLRYLARVLSERDDHECLKWMHGHAGEEPTDYPEKIIRWSYSADSLREILTGIGFTILTVEITCKGFGLHVIVAKK